MLVHSPTLSTEVSLMSSLSQQPLTPVLQKERTSASFNKQENQQSSNKVLLDETKNNIYKTTETISGYTQKIDKVQEQISPSNQRYNRWLYGSSNTNNKFISNDIY